MTATYFCLALRLAGPLQSWGGRSQFNRRDTQPEPTKSGIIGLLAAARGTRRADPIEDLAGLRLGVRTDQPGTLLRDYHTASTLDGQPLLSASVNTKGLQKRTSPAKPTHVTTRYYLQDAAFVAAVCGPPELLVTLVAALRDPVFPLALGRRSCPPTHPVLLASDTPDRLWAGDLLDVLSLVPAQSRQVTGPLPVTFDDPAGDTMRSDVPTTFDPLRRAFSTRVVRHTWVTPPDADQKTSPHDPFALLGGG